MGLLTAGGRGRGAKRPSLPEICHTYPAMMKLGRVILYHWKIQKIYKSRNTPLEFCWHQHFFPGNEQILLYLDIQLSTRFWYIISNFLTFLESLIIVLITMVTILMVWTKMASPSLLKINVFLNKVYDVIIFVHDVTNKFLSRDSN